MDGVGDEWEELASVDEADSYEVDEAHILRHRKTGQYMLRTASGCSCWAGEYDEEIYPSLDALEDALINRGRAYNPSLEGVKTLMAEARARR